MCSFGAGMCSSKTATLILRHLCDTLNIAESHLDSDQSFTSLGGTSLDAIAFVSTCKKTGLNVDISTVLLSATVKDIVHSIICQNKSSSDISNHVSSRQERPNFSTADCEECVKQVQEDYEESISSTSSATIRRSNNTSKSRKRSFEQFLDDYNPMANNSVQHMMTSPKASEETSEYLSEMQMLLIRDTDRQSSNVISYSELYHLSDLSQVRKAWTEVIRQEVSLQKHILIETDEIKVKSERDPVVEWHQIETYSHDDFQKEIDRAVRQVTLGTCFRVVVLNQSLGERSIAKVIWQTHHALLDGYSASLVYVNFQKAIAGLPLLPDQSNNNIIQCLKALQQDRTAEAQQFWSERKELLRISASELKLPPPDPDSDIQGDSTTVITLKSSADKLGRLAQQLESTPCSVYSTAWALVLSRYLCSDCVKFGVVVSGRTLPLPRIESTVGMLINTLPLAIQINQDETIASLVRRIFTELTLLNEMAFTRASDGFDRYFSSAVAMQFDMCQTTNGTLRPIQKPELSISSTIPLSICIDGDGDIQLSYRTTTYAKEDILLMGEHLEQVLDHMLSGTSTVGTCLDSLMPPKMTLALSKAANFHQPSTRKGFRTDTLLTLFRKSADKYADLIALEQGATTISYQGLYNLIQRVSCQLRHAIQPGNIVCIHSDRSINWIIAIYAVIYLGGVFAPLNPDSSREMREHHSRECGSQVFLAPYDSQIALAPDQIPTRFSIQSLLLAELDVRFLENPATMVNPDAPAYVCFTSGSTGAPKAVLCTHQGLVAFQSTLQVRLMAAPHLRISQVMSPVFDGSIHEIFSSLSYGATLVLAKSAEDPLSHLSQVDSAIMTPSLAAVLDPHEYPNLKYVYLVGENVSQNVCDSWATGRELYNMYGPTEATCGATICRLHLNQRVTIGRPNPTSRVYLLDHHRRQVPPGVIGEIYLAGVQVARGYIGRPNDTSARFLPDSVNPDFGEAMYRTGDYGYWTNDYQIVYTGRRDRQVKVRGFRIDLDDLESRISTAVPKSSGVAVAYDRGRLMALMRPATLSQTDIYKKLRQALEPQFIPRHVRAVDEFPLNPAGKVNYPGIPDLISVPHKPESARVMSATEYTLHHMWKDILDCNEDDQVSTSSNFLSLGGHSISQLALINQIEKSFKFEVDRGSILDLATRGTLEDMAKAIDTQRQQQKASNSYKRLSIDCDRDDASSVSDAELRWWHTYQNSDTSSQLNVTMAWNLSPGQVDTDRLVKAWNLVLKRHEIFRSSYHRDMVESVKRCTMPGSPTVLRVGQIDLDKECNRPFDIEKEHLIRVFLSSEMLFLCASHIILDLTTVRVILHQVASAYTNKNGHFIQGSHESPRHRTISITTRDQTFWNDLLRSPLKSRHDRSEGNLDKKCNGSSILLSLGVEATKNLEHLARQYQVTKHQAVTTAVAIALTADEQQTENELVIGAPWNNRKSNMEDAIGLYLEILPLVIPRSDLPSDNDSKTVSKLLSTVRQASQASLSHAVPWKPLCASLLETRRDEHYTQMLLDAMVTFHEELPKLEVSGLDPVMTWSQGAKFRIMFEFNVYPSGEMVLRVEYSSAVYTKEDALRLGRKVKKAIQVLASNSRNRDDSIPTPLSSFIDVDPANDEAERLFGTVIG